jgi:RNase H-like domain found in reverse transcriptase
MIRGISVPASIQDKKSKKGAYKQALISSVLGDKWGPEQEKAFARMKALLTLAPVLITVDNNEPLVVGTDASAKGLAAYLAQFRDTKDASGQTKRILHLIAFASRRNSLSEHKEHSFELELQGVKWALEKFHKFVWGHQIILKTDCKAVKDLLSNRSLPPTHARYKETILSYDIINFIHQEGRTNPADGLSRSGLPIGPLHTSL